MRSCQAVLGTGRLLILESLIFIVEFAVYAAQASRKAGR
jgi:hypothetical protein